MFMNRIQIAIVMAVASIVLALGTAEAQDGENDVVHAGLEAAVAGSHRSDARKARDKYRHPVEALSFFGIQPDMTVVEITPGGGWYTDILAPFLKDEGAFYAAGYDRDSDVGYFQRNIKRFDENYVAKPEIFGTIHVTEISKTKSDIAPAGSADMVLTFRNLHNWMGGDYAPEVFGAMYKALKPGGVMGLVEHRGDPKVEQDPKAESGYVNQDHAVELAQAAGFVLIATSEVNANPKDDKDHPSGVWTLPPSFALKKLQHAYYEGIGESDRMTLKFIKPLVE